MNTPLDLRGLKCPLPILRAKKALASLEQGDQIEILATDKGAPEDFEAFCKQTGHRLLLNTTLPDHVFKLIIEHK